MSNKNFFQKLNLYLIFSLLCLNAIGLLNLYSASSNISRHLQDVFSSQIMWLCIGWVVFIVITLFDYRFFVKLSYLFYGLNLLALLYVMFFGKVSLGAQRWIDLGPIHYQPSETMKLAIILMMAAVLSNYPAQKRFGFIDLIKPLTIILIPFLITAEQPDLGTALMLLMIGGSMLLAMRIRATVIISAIVFAMIAVPVAWNFGLKQYQKNRVLTFLNPTKDPRGTGYNSIQAKIAVGSGQVFGKGFRNGSQSQLEFLPEKHTDFIFCVLSEEHGFLGSLATLGFYSILLISILQSSFLAKDMQGSFVCIGVFAYILWHVFVNVGMVTGLLPIVGVPLPLISYGGSSNLSLMVGMGWASSVYFRKDMF
ncbi:MAG: rod shape-determining protein RodA [Bdellovibrionales bacterium]|nr:rod shape-determining protein RodA [Bdellovibrionales bacterium]